MNPSHFLVFRFSVFPSTSAGYLVGSAPCVGALYENMFPYLVAPKPHGWRFPSRGSRNRAKALRKPRKTICSITLCSISITFHSIKITFRSIRIIVCSIKITFCFITITFCLIKITISSIKSLFAHSL